MSGLSPFGWLLDRALISLDFSQNLLCDYFYPRRHVYLWWSLKGQPYLLLQVICLFLPPFHLYNSLIVICFVLATVQETVYKTCYLSLQLTPHLCLCFPSLLSLAEPWSFSVVCPLFSVSLSTPPTRKHDQNFNHKKRPQFHVPFKKEQGALLPSHDSFKYCQTSSNAQPTCLTDLPPLFLLSYFCDLPIHSNLALAPTASINILWHISPIDFHLSNSVNFFFFYITSYLTSSTFGILKYFLCEALISVAPWHHISKYSFCFLPSLFFYYWICLFYSNFITCPKSVLYSRRKFRFMHESSLSWNSSWAIFCISWHCWHCYC